MKRTTALVAAVMAVTLVIAAEAERRLSHPIPVLACASSDSYVPDPTQSLASAVDECSYALDSPQPLVCPGGEECYAPERS